MISDNIRQVSIEERTVRRQVGLNIILLRRSRWLTQRMLSAKTGIKVTTISYMESGRANPSIKYLVKLAEFFDVPISQFFERREMPKLYDREELKVQRGKWEIFKDLPAGINACREVLLKGEVKFIEVPFYEQLALHLDFGEAWIKGQTDSNMLLVGQSLSIPGPEKLKLININDQKTILTYLLTKKPLGL